MSDDKQTTEEQGIISDLFDSACTGIKFVLKVSVIALMFLVIQEFPEESKAVAVWVFETIRDFVMWVTSHLSEVELNPKSS